MIEWDAARIAAAAGACLADGGEPAAEEHGAGGGPRRVVIDSRVVQPGDLFVGLPGARVDGGSYAAQALAGGAWGVMVAPEHARALADAGVSRGAAPVEGEPGEGELAEEESARGAVLARDAVLARGAVLAHPDPSAGLQSLARAWREGAGEGGSAGGGGHGLHGQDLDEGHPRGAAPRSASAARRAARWRARRTSTPRLGCR